MTRNNGLKKEDLQAINGQLFDISKPSDLILYALQALKNFEQTDRFAVDMDNFRAKRFIIDLEDDGDPVCFACLGGAAYCAINGMTDVRTFRAVSVHDATELEDVLDHARIGHVGSLFDLIGLDYDAGAAFDRVIINYEEAPEQFYAEMTTLAGDLAKTGY